MKTIQIQPIREDITIIKETNLRGIHNGNVTVTANAVFIVNGIVNGEITIDEQAEVIIWGMVNGNIINAGVCRIVGSIAGQLIEKGGRFEIDKNALIKPKQ